MTINYHYFQEYIEETGKFFALILSVWFFVLLFGIFLSLELVTMAISFILIVVLVYFLIYLVRVQDLRRLDIEEIRVIFKQETKIDKLIENNTLIAPYRKWLLNNKAELEEIAELSGIDSFRVVKVDQRDQFCVHCNGHLNFDSTTCLYCGEPLDNIKIYLRYRDNEILKEEALVLQDIEKSGAHPVHIKFLDDQRRITYLDLSGTGLKRLPDSIIKLSALTRIDLQGNNLSELPADFEKLENLTQLGLDFNEFEEIPKNLFLFKKLKTITLSGNYIDKIPASIKYAKNLEFLDLSANPLEELPKELRYNQSLKHLDLNMTYINSFLRLYPL